MKRIFTLIAICTWGGLQAQFFDRLAVSAEYRYLGRNVAGLGLEYRISDRDAIAFNVGAKAFYTSIGGKAKVLPQFNMEYGRLLTAGASVTPYAVEPQFILNFLNFIKLNTGYAVPIHKEKYFRGVTFGIQINIAVGKDTRFYDEFKMGF